MTLSEVGLEYNYTVSVIDRLNIRSSAHTCGNFQSKTVTSSGFDFLFVAIILLCVAVVPAIVLTAEHLRFRRCDRSLYEHEWGEQNESHEQYELVSTEMDVNAENSGSARESAIVELDLDDASESSH